MFMNQDLGLIETLGQLNIPFSVTVVNEQTEPQYPEFCDVIDCWCYSMESPRCPREILNFLNNFQNETALFWSQINDKAKGDTVHRFLKLLKDEMDHPKRKTDNILVILYNGMKMMRLPQDYIDKVVEYVRTEHVKV